jgi:hypothetical protein
MGGTTGLCGPYHLGKGMFTKEQKEVLYPPELLELPSVEK